MQRQQEKESHLGLVADLGGGGRGGPSQGLRRLWSSSGNRGTLQGSSSGSWGQSGRGAERHPLPAPGRQSHSPGPGGGHRPGGAAGGGQGRPVAGMGAVRLSPLGEDAPRPCASPHAQRLCIQLGLRALWGGGHSHVHAAEGRGSSQAGPGQARAAKPGSAWKNTNPNLPSPTQKHLEGVGFPRNTRWGTGPVSGFPRNRVTQRPEDTGDPGVEPVQQDSSSRSSDTGQSPAVAPGWPRVQPAPHPRSPRSPRSRTRLLQVPMNSPGEPWCRHPDQRRNSAAVPASCLPGRPSDAQARMCVGPSPQSTRAQNLPRPSTVVRDKEFLLLSFH